MPRKAKKPTKSGKRQSLAGVSTAALLRELERRNAIPKAARRASSRSLEAVPMSAGVTKAAPSPNQVKATVTGSIRTLDLIVEGFPVDMHQDPNDTTKFGGESEVVVIEPVTGAVSFFSDGPAVVKIELSIDGEDLDPIFVKSKGGKSGYVPFSVFS